MIRHGFGHARLRSFEALPPLFVKKIRCAAAAKIKKKERKKERRKGRKLLRLGSIVSQTRGSKNIYINWFPVLPRGYTARRRILIIARKSTITSKFRSIRHVNVERYETIFTNIAGRRLFYKYLIYFVILFLCSSHYNSS